MAVPTDHIGLTAQYMVQSIRLATRVNRGLFMQLTKHSRAQCAIPDVPGNTDCCANWHCEYIPSRHIS
jgi:hypothetical protein